jgi:hypothetical protein
MPVMRRCLLGLVLLCTPAQALDDLNVFGYFQSTFRADDDRDGWATSFSVQQLNLFLQHRLTARWTGFVNLEAVNSFSTQRNTGDFSLEEAWVRYSVHKQHNLKLGQLIPVFGKLNEVKNRTPVLPYIIRPLVYEAALGEILALEEYWPGRAYTQVAGWWDLPLARLEYAAYLGNSPNINTDPESGQTGADTTASLLVGGRIGLQRGRLRLGHSYTREGVDVRSIDNTFVQRNRDVVERFEGHIIPELRRQRFAWDASWESERYYLSGELIDVDYSGWPASLRLDDAGPAAELPEHLQPSLDKLFAYVVVGWLPAERWETYLLTSSIEEDLLIDGIKYRIETVAAGAAFHVTDRTVLKAQAAWRDDEGESDDRLGAFPVPHEHTSYLYALAVSVFF